MDSSNRQITKIAREANKLVIQSMKDLGIGSSEIDLIHFVRHHPGTSQKEIHEELGMDKGALARRVANLEKKGYLIRQKNPADGRSQLIYATEKAEQLKTSKTSVESSFYEWLFEALSDEQQEEFLSILNDLYLRSKRESRSGFQHIKNRNEKSESFEEA